jgi:hypothetical protein
VQPESRALGGEAVRNRRLDYAEDAARLGTLNLALFQSGPLMLSIPGVPPAAARQPPDPPRAKSYHAFGVSAGFKQTF